MNSFILTAQTAKIQEESAQAFTKQYSIDPLDIIVINKKENSDEEQSKATKGIALIRFVSEKLLLKPLRGKKKALIILEAHTLSIPAQNALLKTLEEPPESTIIIVTTDNPLSLLPTILSRCQKIEGKLSPTSEASTDSFFLSTPMSHHIAFQKAEELAKEKSLLLSFLEKEMIHLHSILMEHASDRAQSKKLYHILTECLSCYRLIKTTNVNVRFALENLFLSI